MVTNVGLGLAPVYGCSGVVPRPKRIWLEHGLTLLLFPSGWLLMRDLNWLSSDKSIGLRLKGGLTLFQKGSLSNGW